MLKTTPILIDLKEIRGIGCAGNYFGFFPFRILPKASMAKAQ